MSCGAKVDLQIPPHTVVASLQVRSKMKVKGIALPIETNLKKQLKLMAANKKEKETFSHAVTRSHRLGNKTRAFELK